MENKAEIEYLGIENLIPYARNSRTHSDEQVAQIAASIREFGFTNPVLVDGEGGIIAGHGRVMAARRLGLGEVPCIRLGHLTEAQKKAYVIADNKLALNAGWDNELLAIELAELDALGFDLELTGFVGDELTEAMFGELALEDDEKVEDEQEHGSLAEQFGAPPFSVLDTRQGYWQERRKKWLRVTGNLTETKEGVLGSGENMLAQINEGSSNFDPVLAELMMSWFCPEGGRIIDPFGGEQTKGVVAGNLGLQYRAVEFRADQVAVNRAACAKYAGVAYVNGDSQHISELIPEREFDFCFTSPPYYDLEVYSKDDMSALGTYAEFMAMYERIFTQCVFMLRDNAFLVIKIGEIRDKKNGHYRNFVGDNIAMFNRLGLVYYNEIILLNSFGTAPQRAGRSFNTRKMVKVHQNVLVFVKGCPIKAAEACGGLRAMTFADGGGDAA